MALPTTTRQYELTEVGTFENLKLAEVGLRKLKDLEVLVKVHAVSLQYRDLVIASGEYPLKVKLENLIPCSDMAGEIIAVGADVNDWKRGDRVCANFAADHIYGDTSAEIQLTAHGGAIDGVLTDYKIFKAHSLVKVPDHLSYEEASTLPCAAVTAYNTLLGPVPLKAGDWVLVQGTGGVSIFGLQFAVASGATVIATSSSDEKLKIASKLGAKHVINYKKTPDWDQEVLKITGGRGVDHVIEVAGTMTKSANAVRYGGFVNNIGFVAGSKNDDFNVVISTIGKGMTIRGIQIGSVKQFKEMNALMIANPETTRPVIDKVFGFEDAISAYAYLKSQAHVGKVVIKVSKD